LVDLSILRLAVCEIKYYDTVPIGVSINEAVNLAKKFSDEESASYINGVLGSIANKESKNE
jgi:N utilization substance protein B